MKDLLRNFAAWVNGSTLNGYEAAALDKGVNEALDGAGGGAYEPTETLHIGGKGIQDAYNATYALEPGANSSVANIAAHRVWVTGGAGVTGYLTLSLAIDGDGASREISIDQLNSGVTVYVRDENGTLLPRASFANHDVQKVVTFRFERLAGSWVCVGLSSSPDSLYSISANDTPVSSPATNALTDIETWWGGDEGLSGVYIFTLPAGASGTRRRVVFPRLKARSSVAFQFGTSTIGYFISDGAGDRMVTCELVKVNSTWKLVSITKLPMIHGELTQFFSSVGSADAVQIDTNNFVRAVITTEVGYTTHPQVRFKLKPPLFEGQRLEIIFQSLVGAEALPVLYVYNETGVNQLVNFADQAVGLIGNWSFSPRYLSFEDVGGVKQWGGRMATMLLAVIDGAWVIQHGPRF